ncbi:MAG: response regulator [Alphaproteobacteria bacterium]|nr:response regulator [Alphaproteobacteria bacterium]MBU1515573.1 response regulator [Alphaproteobacteria bacterium]MBU2095571.1 response regulator [Alphaproteobacteria bacterium]MBU2150812.1 response regulator [Alphaproteobacteria bacterium]MBU2307077.1 response regulator [Alphaproteobacteria bacterium]
MTPLARSVLIVDDEAIIAELWSVYVEAMGIQVCGVAATADDAVSLAEQHRPAIVLMDMRLRGGGDGVDAALAIHALVGSKMIFITGSQEPGTMARIQLDHPSAVLIKPVPQSLFTSAVAAALASA